jgi:hypothetical protein
MKKLIIILFPISLKSKNAVKYCNTANGDDLDFFINRYFSDFGRCDDNDGA